MKAEKVKTRDSAKSKHLAFSSAPRLARTTFKTSREMDFFSERELVTQIGHEIGAWPLVTIKELVDNALDACAETDISPAITMVADACGIAVSDNGPGLPESTLRGAMDFTVRASNREAYVSPTRGAQGNALKTLLPMPWVIDPDQGRFIIEARGKRHAITCGTDPISQPAVIHDDIKDMATNGTSVRLEWAPRADHKGNVLWPLDNLPPLGWPDFSGRFREMVEGFAVFNPHATITLDWFGTRTTWKATDPAWPKWKPCRPISTHWYEQPHLERLIGAYITHDREAGTDRLVSDFIAEFDGLTGSKKRTKVLETAGLKRVKLSDLIVGNELDSDRIAKLLDAMQKHTRPVNPKTLGIIGEIHLRARLLAMGVQPESFQYSKKLGGPKSKNSRFREVEKPSFLPWVLESAFGWLGDESEDRRRIFSGANWSAAIGNPFRSFGSTGEGLETALAEFRATRNEPVVFVLHLAHPRVEYTNRGKSALVIGGASS